MDAGLSEALAGSRRSCWCQQSFCVPMLEDAVQGASRLLAELQGRVLLP